MSPELPEDLAPFSAVFPTMEGGASSLDLPELSPVPMDIVDTHYMQMTYFIIVRHDDDSIAPYNVAPTFNTTHRICKPFLQDSWHSDSSFCHRIACTEKQFQDIWPKVKEAVKIFCRQGSQPNITVYASLGGTK